MTSPSQPRQPGEPGRLGEFGPLWHGRRAMRVSIGNWSTTQADVDRGVAAVLAAAQQAGRTGHI